MSKSSAAEFIQYLKPVGWGPSLKTCPRWASQLEHFTSVLTIPNELSSNSFIELLLLGIKKLGQPQPASYFENDSNNRYLLREDADNLAFDRTIGIFLLDVRYIIDGHISVSNKIRQEGLNFFINTFTNKKKSQGAYTTITSLPYILHQADMLAARVEWEMEWLPKFSQNSVEEPKKQFKLSNNKTSTKNKALNSIKSEGLKNMLDNI